MTEIIDVSDWGVRPNGPMPISYWDHDPHQWRNDSDSELLTMDKRIQRSLASGNTQARDERIIENLCGRGLCVVEEVSGRTPLNGNEAPDENFVYDWSHHYRNHGKINIRRQERTNYATSMLPVLWNSPWAQYRSIFQYCFNQLFNPIKKVKSLLPDFWVI